MREYADCIYCGGQVKEQCLAGEIRWKAQLYLVEDVPTGVCTQCGEKVLKPQVAKAEDKLLEKGSPVKKVEVPVLSYTADAMQSDSAASAGRKQGRHEAHHPCAAMCTRRQYPSCIPCSNDAIRHRGTWASRD